MVRRNAGGKWMAYLTWLTIEVGIEDPTDDQTRRFYRRRQGEKAGNDGWEPPSDPDSRITRMTDGSADLA
jgi:hypothetical protein